MRKILLMDNTNFVDFPAGGTLSFDKQLLKVIPPDCIALVGITTDNNIKVRRWTKLEINNQEYDFFPFMYVSPKNSKPLIPLRLISFFYLFISLKGIRKKRILNLFTQSPQFLFALKYFRWNSICFCFAGLGNSVGLSRYKYLRFLGNIYEKSIMYIMKYHVDTILAAADKLTIQSFSSLYPECFRERNIISFPTRFDKNIYYPLNMNDCRDNLSLSKSTKIIVTIGRISWVKGWDLLCELIELKKNENYQLIFVGDGEDNCIIQSKYSHLISTNKILITGFLPPNMVAQYLNASDIVLVASHQEGWSTAMVEAIACGKPLISTDVSGARDLIIEGKNGFILKERDPKKFVEYIEEVFKLENVEEISVNIAEKYSLDTLYSDLIKNWKSIHNGDFKKDLLL